MNNGLPSRSVLIYRTELLSYSETFIPAQAEYFRAYTPVYVGLKKIQGLTLPAGRTFVAPSAPETKSSRGAITPEFLQALRQTNPALIHAHFEDGGLDATPLAGKLNLPLVVTCHGYDVCQVPQGWRSWPLIGTLRQRRRRNSIQKFSLCIGISRFICDQMLRRGYPAQKMKLHYIGVDVDRFRPDPDVAKQPVILFVGRLIEKKAPLDVLRAMKTVNAKYPEVRLKLYGSGPLLESLQNFARENNLNVEFCGVQPPDVIHQMLKSALMLCLPSVRSANGDSEGLPIVILEAQAAGVPVIATEHAGIPEAIQHGITGLLSREHDFDTLGQNMLALLADSQLREKMGAAGRQRMLQHFNLQVQSGLLEEMYREIV